MRQNAFTIGQVRAFWDGIAEEYDRINRGFGWTHTERFDTMSSFLPPFAAGAAILNVWSRTGSAVPYLRKACPTATITNLEASPRLIALAQKHFPQESFAVTDLHDFPLPNDSQDVVVSLETLEHVPDPLHFLLECQRVLKVGGRLILSTPPAWAELPLRLYERFFENHGEGPHRFRTVAEILRTMEHCGLTVIEHRGTVLCPVGPPPLKKGVEWLQTHLLRYIGTNRLGIRHFFVAEKQAPSDPVWAKIREEIVRPGLSMHSGTEVGLSRGTLTYQDIDGDCVPVPTGYGPVPEICYLSSPEVRPDYPSMNEAVFGSRLPRSTLLGHYRRLAIAHAVDPQVRSGAASGGLLTATLLHLLESGAITGAVVLTMDPEYPWRAKPMIARTRAEILASAQSKYVVSPVNTILETLEHETGPLAYVGLPHQVFAIRRLQALKHPSVRAIRYVLGPFFGNELSGQAVDSFLRKFGATKDQIASLAYRAGEWPGYMQVVLKDGRTLRMPKFHANYLIPFHITQNSLLSHDLTNEFTDVSGGDAWAPVYEERGKGFSLAIARTEVGEDLLRRMEGAGMLSLTDVTEADVLAMQSHGLDFKKRGTFLRLQQREARDLRTYRYGLTLTGVSLGRRAFEWLLGLTFAVCHWPLSQWVADAIPDRIIGAVFVWLRTRWKAATKGVKRAGWGQTELRLTEV